jgi:hypothetical protein
MLEKNTIFTIIKIELTIENNFAYLNQTKRDSKQNNVVGNSTYELFRLLDFLLFYRYFIFKVGFILFLFKVNEFILIKKLDILLIH